MLNYKNFKRDGMFEENIGNNEVLMYLDKHLFVCQLHLIFLFSVLISIILNLNLTGFGNLLGLYPYNSSAFVFNLLM